MATSDTVNITQENLATHLRDIQLPDTVSWWPVAPGWWAVAVLMVFSGLYLLLRRKRNSTGKNLYHRPDRLYADLELDGDVHRYYHRLTGMLREEVYGNASVHDADRHTAVLLYGNNWVDWLEESTGIAFSTAASQLLSNSCYRKFPAPPERTVHNEIARCIVHFTTLNNRSTDGVTTRA